ncbi:sensor histidine kinase [Povalibacter sp.]|uniref:sensor histidine kinase n=1 Tax=Povalibacter sp. TaxID=1962978 RepID=UPI002F424619
MQDLGKKSARISRALLITVTLCFMTLFVSTVVLIGISRTAVRTDEWIARTLEVQDALDSLLMNVTDAEAGQRGYLITRDEQFLATVAAADESLQAQLLRLRSLVADYPLQQQRIEKLAPLLAERLAAIHQTLELAQHNQPQDMNQIVSGRGAQMTQEIRDSIAAMNDSEAGRLIDRRREAAVIREQFIATISGLVIVAGVFAAFALLSVRAYLRGLEESRQRVVAHQAELEARVAERTAELTRTTELAQRERSRAETLLTDVNHRVGNNLALVSSFLTMQQRAVTNPEAVKALSAARARVQAVASSHRKLRLGADFATVKANEVLGAVLDDIGAGLPPDGRIHIDYDLLPLEIHARDAVSLGVLTSELVMNAIKHGFTGGEAGDVRVIFGVTADGPPFLEVSDDGVGYDSNNNENIEPHDPLLAPARGGGLGARIIDMLARQFGGETHRAPLREGARPGTCVRVELARLELMQQP